MNKGNWKSRWITVLMVGGLASMSLAADAGTSGRASRTGRGSYGFISTLEQRVGLTPEQRDAVRGLLAEQRQKSQALRTETDGRIRALLNPEQQKKFDSVLADQKARFARGRSSAS